MYDKTANSKIGNSSLKKLTGTAVCIALALILPQLFHLVGLGRVFLPIHIPVFLCGLAFGGTYGMACGVIAPLLSSLISGMPPLFPQAITMCIELAAYGFIAGYLYHNKKLNIFLAIVLSMLGGRLVYLVAKLIIYGLAGMIKEETWYLMLANTSLGFAKAFPGIVLQLILLPLIIKSLERSKLISSN